MVDIYLSKAYKNDFLSNKLSESLRFRELSAIEQLEDGIIYFKPSRDFFKRDGVVYTNYKHLTFDNLGFSFYNSIKYCCEYQKKIKIIIEIHCC